MSGPPALVSEGNPEPKLKVPINDPVKYTFPAPSTAISREVTPPPPFPERCQTLFPSESNLERAQLLGTVELLLATYTFPDESTAKSPKSPPATSCTQRSAPTAVYLATKIRGTPVPVGFGVDVPRPGSKSGGDPVSVKNPVM